MSFAIEKEERFAAYNAQMCLAHARNVRQELQDKLEQTQRTREGRDRETTVGLTSKPVPIFACGVVAGLRHCHTIDAPGVCVCVRACVCMCVFICVCVVCGACSVCMCDRVFSYTPTAAGSLTLNQTRRSHWATAVLFRLA